MAATATVQMSVDVPVQIVDIANDLLDLCDKHPDFTVIESMWYRPRSGSSWRIQTDIRVGSRTRVVYAQTDGYPGKMLLGERPLRGDGGRPRLRPCCPTWTRGTPRHRRQPARYLSERKRRRGRPIA